MTFAAHGAPLVSMTPAVIMKTVDIFMQSMFCRSWKICHGQCQQNRGKFAAGINGNCGQITTSVANSSVSAPQIANIGLNVRNKNDLDSNGTMVNPQGPRGTIYKKTSSKNLVTLPRPKSYTRRISTCTLQRQNTEISKQIFPGKEYRGLSPNFHIPGSVSDLYIPMIGLPILLEEICRPILGLYKSLTDI